MQAGRVLDYLQVAGNLGLILGLILVGIQIYQNTEIARMQMVHRDMMALEARYLSMTGENPAQVWAKAMSDPDSLAHEEHVDMDNVLKSHLNHIQKLVRLKELGFELIDPKDSRFGMAYYLSSTYGEAWWAENSNLVAPEIREVISSDLDQFPDNYLVQEIESLNSEIAQRIR